jgi:KH domain-containing protein
MKTIFSEKIARIIRNRKKLEEKLHVKITNRGKEVFVEGSPENEYTAEKVLDSLNLGFPFSIAILIKEEDFIFEILNIKDYTKRKDLERIRARIIGTKGKTLQTLHQLTNCNFELKDNYVGIIGPPECMENGQEAIIAIIKGAKQSNVYSLLEKHQVKPVFDLGLKK